MITALFIAGGIVGGLGALQGVRLLMVWTDLHIRKMKIKAAKAEQLDLWTHQQGLIDLTAAKRKMLDDAEHTNTPLAPMPKLALPASDSSTESVQPGLDEEPTQHIDRMPSRPPKIETGFCLTCDKQGMVNEYMICSRCEQAVRAMKRERDQRAASEIEMRKRTSNPNLHLRKVIDDHTLDIVKAASVPKVIVDKNSPPPYNLADIERDWDREWQE